jgi:hypothetical protein
MTTITPEQHQAAIDAGDSPIELPDPQTGISYVLMRADVYRKMQDLLETVEDRREHQAWPKLAWRARGLWSRENS